MSAARDRLLTTAGQLFAERGYECVGINEVIAKANIAKATFYQHFPSKESLCVAWLRQCEQLSSVAQQDLLDLDLPVSEKVARWFDRYINCSASAQGCPFCVTASMIPANSETAQVIRESRSNNRTFWHSLALETGVKPSAARDLGDAWMLLLTGAATEARNIHNSWPYAQAKKAALSLCPQAVTA